MPEFLLIIIPLLAILLVVFVFIKSRKKKFSEKDQKFFQVHWKQIELEAVSNPNHAILNADKLIDKALYLKGFQGSLGEKLKKANSLFSDINGLWSAHKLRNKIAHEINFNASPSEVSRALNSFKKALRNLGLKDNS